VCQKTNQPFTGQDIDLGTSQSQLNLHYCVLSLICQSLGSLYNPVSLSIGCNMAQVPNDLESWTRGLLVLSHLFGRLFSKPHIITSTLLINQYQLCNHCQTEPTARSQLLPNISSILGCQAFLSPTFSSEFIFCCNLLTYNIVQLAAG